jgi:hypothetical protein
MSEVRQEPGKEGTRIGNRLLVARNGLIAGFFFGLFAFFSEIIGDHPSWQLFLSIPVISAIIFGLLALLGGKKALDLIVFLLS